MKRFVEWIKNIGDGNNIAIAEKLVELTKLSTSATLELKTFQSLESCDIKVMGIKERVSTLSSEIYDLVDDTFQPRWNKEKTANLVGKVSGIPDRVRSTLRKMNSYSFPSLTGTIIDTRLRELVEINVQASEKLEIVISELKKRKIDHKQVKLLVSEIKQLESRSDTAREEGEKTLIDASRNGTLQVADLIGWSNILRHLEETTDYASHAAKYVLSLARE